MTGLFFAYIPMQLVAPSAVTIAVATDAMICTMNLMVSLFVIILSFFVLPTDYTDYTDFFSFPWDSLDCWIKLIRKIRKIRRP